MRPASPASRDTGATIVEMRCWSEEEFRASEAEWQGLLARSSADPVFMSWSWQWTWWRHYAPLLKSQLCMLAAYSPQGELVGLAPLHRRRAAHRKPISATRLETLGSTWRDETGAYSEYLDFIVDTRFEEAFLHALTEVLLRDRNWSDLVIANSKRTSVATRFVRERLGAGCYVRETDPITAHLALLPEEFAQYVQSLASAVRRKMWGQRKRLAGARFEVVPVKQVDEAFDLLNDFHQRRWQSQLFFGSFRAFHLEFAQLWAERGSLRLSRLDVDGAPISVMYNVRVGAAEYNIQSGFDTTTKGISPGYLHFGWCIEQACGEGVRRFDFLAGQGRTRNYKQDFVTQETELVTLQCIRARPLAWLYREYDSRVQSGRVEKPGAQSRLTGMDAV